jgi:DNA (cytosine-5)-methyltransferase 1
MRYFSSFTGVGGFEMGLPSEWECVGQSEVDKYCDMVLRYRFPEVKNYGDIQKIEWDRVPDFDIFVGGSPCQDLSLAGKRKGLAGGRSGLFFEFVRALRAKKPEYFIWENVKGALSSNEGRDFAEVQNQFSEAGYDLWWQVLNAKDFNVPHNRERIFVVGFRSRSPPEILFKRKNEGENTENRTIIRTLTGGAHSGGLHSNMTGIFNLDKMHDDSTHITTSVKSQPQADRVYDPRGISPTIQTASGGRHIPSIAEIHAVLTPFRKDKRQNGRRFKEDGEPMFTLTGQDIHGVEIISNSPMHPDTKIRRLTPTECERLMSWPDSWTRWGINEKGEKVEISDTQRYRMCGNGVVSNVVKEVVKLIEEVKD